MTMPNPPAPGAPGDPAPNTPPAPGAPAPAPTSTPQSGQTGQDPNAPIDFASLPANVTHYINQLKNENATHRQGKQAQAAEATEAKQRLDAVLSALGMNPDGTPVADPAAAAAEMAARVEQAEMRAWGASVRLEVARLAAKYGGDADALLDSNSFVDSLEDLYQSDLDPSSDQFRTALGTKITNAVAANPNVRARAAGPARQGADITPSGGGTTGRPSSLREAFARKGQ